MHNKNASLEAFFLSLSIGNRASAALFLAIAVLFSLAKGNERKKAAPGLIGAAFKTAYLFVSRSITGFQ